MDEIRKIRIEVPAFIFVGATAIAALIAKSGGTHPIAEWVGGHLDTTGAAVIGLAGAAVAIVAVGQILGSTTIGLLTAIEYITGWEYEGSLWVARQASLLDRIQKHAGETPTTAALRKSWIRPPDQILTSVVLHHCKMDERAANWVIRRWVSFNLCANSVTGSVLSIGLVCFLKQSFGWHVPVAWFWVMLGLIVVFTLHAIRSWRETGRSIVYYSTLDHSGRGNPA